MSGQNTFVADRPIRNAGDVPFTPTGDVASTTVQTAIAEVDTEKLAKASNLSDVANAATAFANIKQAATEAATGVIELATDAETVTGSATDRATTPANLAAKMAAPGAIGGTTPGTGTFTKLLVASATELTIATGEITATNAVHTVDTESDAASDDLVTIAAGGANQLLLIRAAHADRTVVVKSATGNILTGGADISLTNTDKYLLLVYDAGLSKWVVVGGSAAAVDLASPGPIGGTTPDAAEFTTLTIPEITDTTLSGTPVVFTIYDDSGTPYYFKAYPTKA
jgi:hypothetical protein